MPRSRNIKPGFFVNEDLVELPFETRLLFAGLWTLADREGRLEDRPKKIKMAIFPADDVDVDQSLRLLHNAQLIIRYLVEDKGYIQVIKFAKHQNPHIKEAASVIPAPDGHDANTVLATPLTSSLIPESLSSDKEEKKQETPQAASPPKRGSRIPDEFFLTAEMRSYAAKKRPDVDVTLETEKFCNHYRSATGRNATRLDWKLTWRNWILNSKVQNNGSNKKNTYGSKRTDADVFAESADFYANYTTGGGE